MLDLDEELAILSLCTHSCGPHAEDGGASHSGGGGASHAGGDGSAIAGRGTTSPLLHKAWFVQGVAIERRKWH